MQPLENDRIPCYRRDSVHYYCALFLEKRNKFYPLYFCDGMQGRAWESGLRLFDSIAYNLVTTIASLILSKDFFAFSLFSFITLT